MYILRSVLRPVLLDETDEGKKDFLVALIRVHKGWGGQTRFVYGVGAV